ncbi:MAG: 2-phospho-L-lactate transferase [bacterium]|nr:2-phospho-L-lactate transferase [bacterium]MDE0600299.1 2-phospho-L-lactate transferase [bacterium]
MRTLDEKPGVLLLSGGVGGARMARGFARLEEWNTTVVVNTGDDDWVYGVFVAPDLDTVVYTLAGVEGPQGWGLANETWEVMEALADFPVDTTFRLGDGDLATNLYRTMRIREGKPLSLITDQIASTFKIGVRLLPATDQPLRTKLRTVGGEWLDFQDYFVRRQHRDRIGGIRFDGAEAARPAPGVIEAIRRARAVIIAPSNPPLSIWPILAVPGVRSALEAAETVIAVSPLFGGKALKGPAADVMDGLGLPAGNRGVAEAYRGLLSGLVVDTGDAEDVGFLSDLGLRAWATDTRIAEPAAAARLAAEIMAAL